MNNIYKDISSKIDSSLVGMFVDLKRLISKPDIPFVLVGAGARDIFFGLIFGIKSPTATLDADVAIRVPSWDAFRELADKMENSGLLKRDKKYHYRFKHMDGQSLDLLPFGQIERPKGNIRWPSDQNDMSTVGFEEAQQNSIIVRICRDCEINVATPPALMITKIIAWDGGFPTRPKDAKDIDFMLREYSKAGNEQRIYNEDRDISQLPDFDFSRVSPRLLGRDIAKIASDETIAEILKILRKETDQDAHYSLIRDMMKRDRDFDEEFAEKLMLLNQLKLGIEDGKHRST
jgi:predicted nucleotidyltransferase